MTDHRHWLDLLEDEDLAFLKRFVLASGSLKELAEAYGISYPRYDCGSIGSSRLTAIDG